MGSNFNSASSGNVKKTGAKETPKSLIRYSQ